MKQIFIALLCMFLMLKCHAQLVIQNGAGLFLQDGAIFSVQDNVNAYEDISGAGVIYLNGNTVQFIGTNGFSIPKILIDNKNNVVLSGNSSIAQSLIFSEGKLLCNDFDLRLGDQTVITGAGKNNFIETNGTGSVLRLVAHNLSSYRIPIGNANYYSPVDVSTTGQYSNAYIKISSRHEPSMHKHANSMDYLKVHWPVKQAGIKGSVHAVAFFDDVDNVKGNSNNLKAIYWDGKTWNSKKGTLQPGKEIAVDLTAETGEIYAMSIDNLPALLNTVCAWPNPAKDNVNLKVDVQSSGKGIIYLTDAVGRLVYSSEVFLTKGVNFKNIPVATLAKGFYNLCVGFAGEKNSLKLIRQ